MSSITAIRSPLRASRIAMYFTVLRELEGLGQEVVTARELARQCGVQPHVLKEDVGAFGSFGQPGKGYDVRILRMSLERILAADKAWPAVIVGAGATADAVARSEGFDGTYAAVVGVFDLSSSFHGTKAAGHVVQPMSELAATVQTLGVQLGVVATSEDVAQDAADLLVLSGVLNVLNVTNRVVRLPAGALVEHVSITGALHTLAFRRREWIRDARGARSTAGDDFHGDGRSSGDLRQVGVFEGYAAVEEDGAVDGGAAEAHEPTVDVGAAADVDVATGEESGPHGS